MKKVINITKVKENINSLNDDNVNKNAEAILKAVIDYNMGKCDLDYNFIPDYNLNNLIEDFNLEFTEQPITSELAIIYDNGGNSYDRYEIMIATTGEVHSCCEHPFHPQGMAQYAGNVCQFIFGNTIRDKYYKDGLYITSWIKKSLTEYRLKLRMRGYRPIPFHKLPTDVQKYISQILN